MARTDDTLPQILREAIDHLKEPILFQQMLQDADGKYSWRLLDWSVLDLAEKIDNVKLPFRTGINCGSVNPQWEVNCPTTYMTLKELLESEETSKNNMWYYFDYKHMQEWFTNNNDIMASLNWRNFGFDKDGSESTIWIGSTGAHTNCHQDSYGCNLVAQIHGRKQWLLFPPHASNSLKPTRVPYEESTIYSTFNFFCPNLKTDAAILNMKQKPKLITLEKGDVLLVPKGWWHYVESLDLSISVNIWLPLREDNLARIKEGIVKAIIATIGHGVCSSGDANGSLSYCMQLLNSALKKYKDEEEQENKHTISKKKRKENEWKTEMLAAEYPKYIKQIPDLTEHEFRNFLKDKRHRFRTPLESVESSSVESAEHLTQSLVNALCHPDVINIVTNLLVNSTP